MSSMDDKLVLDSINQLLIDSMILTYEKEITASCAAIAAATILLTMMLLEIKKIVFMKRFHFAYHIKFKISLWKHHPLWMVMFINAETAPLWATAILSY